MNGTEKVTVMWSRFGPYHIARLSAAGRYFSSREKKVYGVEIAKEDSAHLWELAGDTSDFDRRTLFTNKNYQNLTSSEIWHAVISVLDELNPSVVAVPGWRFVEARAAVYWCLKNRKICIMMSAINKDDKTIGFWERMAKRLFINCYDGALVGGSTHKNYLESLGFPLERIRDGYDVVDNDYFARSAEEIKNKRNAFIGKMGLSPRNFIVCCRLIPEKNLFSLLDAYAIYRQNVKNAWGLLICGDGPLKNELMNYAVNKKITGVVWAGFVEYKDLPMYYSIADVLILPSISETWGLVVNEAMASGLPVIVSSKCGCSDDLVKDGVNGYKFDPNNATLLADLMRRISTNEDELVRMGKESSRIIKNWSPLRFAESLWHLLQMGKRESSFIEMFVKLTSRVILPLICK